MANRRHLLKCALVCAASLQTIPTASLANNRTVKVKFKPGSSSAHYKGRIKSVGADVYEFKADARQTISLDLETNDATLIFTVNDRSTGESLTTENNGVWSDVLPSDGAYEIVVAFLSTAKIYPDSVADYKLTILIG
jgi:hypothetical protein